jgi:hypothetical protein
VQLNEHGILEVALKFTLPNWMISKVECGSSSHVLYAVHPPAARLCEIPNHSNRHQSLPD